MAASCFNLHRGTRPEQRRNHAGVLLLRLGVRFPSTPMKSEPTASLSTPFDPLPLPTRPCYGPVEANVTCRTRRILGRPALIRFEESAEASSRANDRDVAGPGGLARPP